MATAPPGGAPRDVQRLAHWLDEAFTVPGTRFRIGWDGIVGLIPGAGDLLTAAPALWIVLRAVNLGVPNTVAARMVLNILIDGAVGAIPLVGDLFDMAWKANRRNAALLERYQRDPLGTRRRSTAEVGAAALVLLVVGAAVVVLPVLVLIWLIRTIGAGAA